MEKIYLTEFDANDERLKNFQTIYLLQKNFQESLLLKGKYKDFSNISKFQVLPYDDSRLFSYHIQQLISEIGEVLESDKRWKSHRNDKYDRRHKVSELADCFIVLLNLLIFSGIESDEFLNEVLLKMQKNTERVNEEAKKGKERK